MSYKTLGQVAITTANTLTELYLVPSGKQTVISSLFICNRSSSFINKVRVLIKDSEDNAEEKHYIYYDVLIPPKNTYIATVGITMGEGYHMQVYSDSTDITFNLFGKEI